MNTQALPYVSPPVASRRGDDRVSADAKHVIMLILSILGSSLVGTAIAVFGVIDVAVSILGMLG